MAGAGVMAAATAAVVLGLLGGAVTGYFAGRTAGHDAAVKAAPSSSASPTQDGDVSDVVSRVLPSTVQVLVTTADGGDTGSGFVIDDQGDIATNNHVIDLAATDSSAKLEIRTSNGLFTTATIVGRSPSYDVAVIRARGLRAPVAALGDSSATHTGQPVIAIGAPLALAGTVTKGIISAEDRPVVVSGSTSSVAFINAIQTDAAINPGNSGGPLIDLTGKVIGINSAGGRLSSTGESGSIGLGFAIPANDANRVINQIMTDHHATFPVLGAYPDPEYVRGARVKQVTAGSPADKAGIKPGDVISTIAGQRVLSPSQMMVMIREQMPDSSVSLVVTRNGKDYPVLVKLGSGVG